MQDTRARNKWLAAILALAMAVTMIPSLAFAADDGSTDVKYIIMNVPYNDFYAPYQLTDKAVWTQDDGVDGVSTATTTKFAGTTGLANGTYNNGKYIKGVRIPVAVSAADYAGLTGKVADETALGTAGDYSFVDLAQAPAYYSSLTIASGKKSFSALQASTIDTSYLGIGDLDDDKGDFIAGAVDLDDGYGDYQLTVKGISNETRKIQTGADTYEDCTVYGAILNTAGGTYGMTALENLWFGSRRPNVEIAWSVPNGQNLKRGHGSGGLFYQFQGLNGATLTGVTLITNLGVIDIPQQITLQKYYDGDLSALKYSIASGVKTLNISGIPAALQDVKVTVGALGGGAVSDGKVTLNRAPVDGTNYTITISSSNYPDITRTVSTPISADQKAQLQSWIDKAKAATGYATNKDLQEHVQEAVDMLANANATSYEAAELIGELTEKVKKTYPALNAAATLKAGVLTITLPQGTALTDLKNPSWDLGVSSRRGSTTVDSGNLTDLKITVNAALTAGTEYTLTIASDNFQDVKLALPYKDSQTLTVKAKAATVKAKKVKKAKQTVKAITVSGNQTTVTYKKASGSAKLTVNAKTGKITVKKGAKKGTYTAKIKVTAAASDTVNAASKTVTVKVKVK